MVNPAVKVCNTCKYYVDEISFLYDQRPGCIGPHLEKSVIDGLTIINPLPHARLSIQSFNNLPPCTKEGNHYRESNVIQDPHDMRKLYSRFTNNKEDKELHLEDLK